MLAAYDVHRRHEVRLVTSLSVVTAKQYMRFMHTRIPACMPAGVLRAVPRRSGAMAGGAARRGAQRGEALLGAIRKMIRREGRCALQEQLANKHAEHSDKGTGAMPLRPLLRDMSQPPSHGDMRRRRRVSARNASPRTNCNCKLEVERAPVPHSL